MRKLTLLAAVALGAASTPAFATAQVQEPTLHGFCAVANPCPENVTHTNSPTSVNPPIFGFSSGGHNETGTVLIDILVPDNLTIPGPFTISGALLGANTFVATLFDQNGGAPGTPPWTSGQLDAYLGLPQGSPPPVSPANPIGAFLPATQAFQPSATGFYVFQANIGSVTLPSNSNAADSFLMQLDHSLAQGSYIVGFITEDRGGTYGATANSGAILETSPPPGGVPEPATWAMMLVGFGAAGTALRRSRRKALLAQFA